MRYAIIQYTVSKEYDIVDFKRNRISAVNQPSLGQLAIEYKIRSPQDFWFPPDDTITQYLEDKRAYTILYQFHLISRFVSEHPEEFI